MASNPIKRRARQSFFLGFLIALVVMAVVVMLLFTKINSLNEENEKLKILGPKVSVYTVTKDIEEGDAITVEDLEASTMQLSNGSTSIDVANYIDPSIFYIEDEETGESVEASYSARVKIPAGSVVTLSMLQEGGVRNDERLMEYSTVVLPSQLVNGDYIDIRYRLANGTETIVLAKKKVEQCTQTTIWMKMTEEDIQHMNSAIVDSYLATGSQLRATVYTDPLMQSALEEDYPVNSDILNSIYVSPNILEDAKKALSDRWSKKRNDTTDASDMTVTRRVINEYIQATNPTQEGQASVVQGGYETESQTQATARGEYVSSLEGTGMVGVDGQ